MMQGFALKWGWYHTFCVCAAAERKTKEEVMLMGLGEVLYRLSYESDVVRVNRPRS
jgi:hypothetical protein